MCKTPVKNLLTCGASTFPGIGIPAVSASGAYAAGNIIGNKEYKNLLKMLDLYVLLLDFDHNLSHVIFSTFFQNILEDSFLMIVILFLEIGKFHIVHF